MPAAPDPNADPYLTAGYSHSDTKPDAHAHGDAGSGNSNAVTYAHPHAYPARDCHCNIYPDSDAGDAYANALTDRHADRHCTAA